MRHSVRPYAAVIIGMIFLVFEATSQTDPQAILNKFLDRRDKSNWFQADVHIELKLFNMEDTITHKADVEMVRAPTDSLFGGAIH